MRNKTVKLNIIYLLFSGLSNQTTSKDNTSALKANGTSPKSFSPHDHDYSVFKIHAYRIF